MGRIHVMHTDKHGCQRVRTPALQLLLPLWSTRDMSAPSGRPHNNSKSVCLVQVCARRTYNSPPCLMLDWRLYVTDIRFCTVNGWVQLVCKPCPGPSSASGKILPLPRPCFTALQQQQQQQQYVMC